MRALAPGSCAPTRPWRSPCSRCSSWSRRTDAVAVRRALATGRAARADPRWGRHGDHTSTTPTPAAARRQPTARAVDLQLLPSSSATSARSCTLLLRRRGAHRRGGVRAAVDAADAVMLDLLVDMPRSQLLRDLGAASVGSIVMVAVAVPLSLAAWGRGHADAAAGLPHRRRLGAHVPRRDRARVPHRLGRSATDRDARAAARGVLRPKALRPRTCRIEQNPRNRRTRGAGASAAKLGRTA